MVRRLLVFVLAVGSVLALTACGSSEPTPQAGSPTTTTGRPDAGSAPADGTDQTSDVNVVARDISLSAAKFKATPGAVHVTYLNEGNLEHSLRIEKIDGFRLDVPTKGSKDQATVDLPAGTYTIYCDIPGHRQAGMHAQLVVG